MSGSRLEVHDPADPLPALSPLMTPLTLEQSFSVMSGFSTLSWAETLSPS